MIGTHSYHTTPTNTTLHTQSSRTVISPDARVCASGLHTASISRSRTSTSPTSRASPSLALFGSSSEWSVDMTTCDARLTDRSAEQSHGRVVERLN